MLNKYEQEYLEKKSKDEIDRKYFLEQLDLKLNDLLYAKYYNLNAKDRYLIQETEIKVNGCHLELVDCYIRNNFYGCILTSNSYDILEKERQKLIKREKDIKYEQLSLF